MAAINFPNSPTNGTSVIINGIEYTYDSTKLVWKTTDATGAVVPLSVSQISNTANAAFNVANIAISTANTAASTGKAIAMAIVFG